MVNTTFENNFFVKDDEVSTEYVQLVEILWQQNLRDDSWGDQISLLKATNIISTVRT